MSPYASLIFDTHGALYGITGGGSSNAGSVFKLTPPASGTGPWTKTVLYDFKGGNDGYAIGKLIFDAYGALYGITMDESLFQASSQGLVYKLTRSASGTGPWTKTILYSFANGGGHHQEGLLFDTQGALYGTTWDGGSSNKGTVFKLTPSASGIGVWTQTVLYTFTGVPDGREPHAGLIFGRGGALYGTTKWGGARTLRSRCSRYRPRAARNRAHCARRLPARRRSANPASAVPGRDGRRHRSPPRCCRRPLRRLRARAQG